MSPDNDSAFSTNEHHPAHAPRYVADMMSSRHSTRAFLKTPVPRTVLEQALAISQHTPSNTNFQPWRVKIVTGNALQRLTSSLVSTVSSGTPSTTQPVPDTYRPYRSALGRQLYGPEGYDIPRTDEDRMRKAQMRNYTFFDAPCALIVCMERGLAQNDVLSVGMYLQTLCLVLAEQGIATCVEASVAGYPQVIEQELGLVQDLVVLVGVAVGFEDKDHRINHIKAVREAYKNNVDFIDD